MNWTRNLVVGLAASCAIGAFADTGSKAADRSELHVLSPIPPESPSVSVVDAKVKAADGNVLSFLIPKVGFRIGGGEWNEFMVNAGMDVTFNVPFIPLPALRVDGEIWGKPGDFGQDRRGNAISVMGIQTFALAYMGFGPTYYFTDDEGDHHSGLGLKLLGGLSLPHNVYAEAGMIIGPSTPPIFFTIGQRF